MDAVGGNGVETYSLTETVGLEDELITGKSGSDAELLRTSGDVVRAVGHS